MITIMNVSLRRAHREDLILSEASGNSSWVREVRIHTALSRALNPTAKCDRGHVWSTEIDASPHELRLGICPGGWKDLQRLRKRNMPLVVATSRKSRKELVITAASPPGQEGADRLPFRPR